jgi:hypothetical protein
MLHAALQRVPPDMLACLFTEHWDVRLTDLGLAKVILQDPSTRFGRYVMTGGTGCAPAAAPAC